jgi:hypothetical protein
MAIQSYDFFSIDTPIDQESEIEIEETMDEERAYCSLTESILENQ